MSGPLDMDTVGKIYTRLSGTFEEVGEVFIRISSEWKLVWTEATALAVSVPADAYGAASSGSTITVTTSPITATATGGTPPYTYAWNRDDSGSPTWTINSPTAATTTLSVPVAASGFEDAEFECVVTDSLGATVTSSLVFAGADNYGGFS